MTNIVRFAPSPTGLIHIGNARTALLNWLFAYKTGGQFILRFDDTDTARSKQEFADAITADLDWLGIVPERVEYQSKRFEKYDQAADDLKARGLLYPCYETADELDRKRKRQLARGKPPVYDRAALSLSDEDKAKFEAEGRTPHWRFRLDDRTVSFDDLVRGPQSIALGGLSDPVLIRGDGTYLYTLPSVVDDIDFDVTHVIRGEDHVTNAAVQVALIEALGGTVPQFAHHSLLIGADGKGLSKRLGSLSIGSLREAGLEAMAVVSHASLIGTSDAIEPHQDMADLAASFDLSKLSRAPGRFDETELKAINAKLLHELPYKKVQARLDHLGADGGEAFWNAIRGNLQVLDDAQGWHQIVFASIKPAIEPEDAEFIHEAASLLPASPWDQTTWKAWTSAIKDVTGRKGRSLFMPLRKALTGLEHGPELAALLPLIGPARAKERLAYSAG